ncbi:DMT family transporter [Planomicrobium sp. YIM 101495]|uniref:DMT family transporter n=1 Tax=Planomicrobium sp. YIM 101495 TaxID=2665160 RepID=UPI0012B7882B|nr:DMT family transporter [Planomicrobium sp. YIM 101495]MTD31822.1 EamA family transporter [Planomicrobium sp. YIM 101495]
MEKPIVHPSIPIIVGVISMALSAIFVKMTTADSGVTAFYRMLFSVLLLSPILLWKYTHEFKKLSKGDWWLTAIAGIFLSFHFILWFESLNYTSVASSTVLVTMQPLFAFVGTYIFFKERISIKTLVAGVVAISGSVLIGYGDFQVSGSALYGDVLALIACALITSYLLVGQGVRKRLSLMTYTFLVYSFSTITLFFYVIATGESFGPYPAEEWVWFFLLALIPNLFGHSLFNWALKWMSTNVISVSILFEPVGAAILAYFILNEGLSWSQIAGGSVVIAGIVLFVIDFEKIKSKLIRN